MMNIELNDSARRATRVPVAKGRHGRGYCVAVAWVIGAVVDVNAAIIVWLWLRGGGVSAAHGLGDLSTSVGRVTGLLSAYLALLQVLLLARLPPLERLAGFDHLTA